MSEHGRFEELASLSAIGELSPDEQQEFLRHKQTCSKCGEIVAETTSLAAAAFLAGSPKEEDPGAEAERHRRVRAAIAGRLPLVVPAPFARRYKGLVAAGVAAAFLLGAGVGTGVGMRRTRGLNAPKDSVGLSSATIVQLATSPSATEGESTRLQGVVATLKKQMEEARGENRALRDQLAISDRHAAELDKRIGDIEKQSNARTQEVIQVRNELNQARNELTQAKEAVSSSQTTIDSLRYQLADREARLTEVAASLDREREMLSAGREIRDIVGARELHIVDVIDRDGKGRARKPFGRAFYTQGKSLIFYAFDLPSKNTVGGKFVYAAWGSNSNNLSSRVAHSLGIFYNDDQTQHRWAMKFDDPEILQEIDTVFVTLEPAGRPFSSPTGKPLLEAYFGTPPNHP